MAMSAVEFIEKGKNPEGPLFASVEQFALVVHENYPGFSAEYVQQCVNGVLNDDYKSIAPSWGSDAFFVKKIGDDVFATLKPKDRNGLRKYELLI